MATLEIPFAEELAETAHGSDTAPDRFEKQEFDLLAFDLWHLGSCPGPIETEEWPDERGTLAGRASCL